jgi:hypothetical protein
MDKGQYNTLRQKVVQQVYVVSEGQIIQPPTAIVDQVESDRSTGVSVLHILNRQHYPLKF